MERPEWNSWRTDLSKHQLSPKQLLEKKLQAVSHNHTDVGRVLARKLNVDLDDSVVSEGKLLVYLNREDSTSQSDAGAIVPDETPNLRKENVFRQAEPSLSQLRARVRQLGSLSFSARDDQSLSAIFDSNTTCEPHEGTEDTQVLYQHRGAGRLRGRYSMYAAPAVGSRSRHSKSPNASFNQSFSGHSCLESGSVRSGAASGNGGGSGPGAGGSLVLKVPTRLSKALLRQPSGGSDVAPGHATARVSVRAPSAPSPLLPAAPGLPAQGREAGVADTSMASDGSASLQWPLDEQYKVICPQPEGFLSVVVHVGAGIEEEVEGGSRRASVASYSSLASDDTQLLLQGIDSFIRRQSRRRAPESLPVDLQVAMVAGDKAEQPQATAAAQAVHQADTRKDTVVGEIAGAHGTSLSGTRMRMSFSEELPQPRSSFVDTLPALQPWEARHGAPVPTPTAPAPAAHTRSHTLAEVLEEEAEAPTVYAYVPAEDALARARRVLEGIHAARGASAAGGVAAQPQPSVPSTPTAPFTASRVLLTGGVETVLNQHHAANATSLVTPAQPCPAPAAVAANAEHAAVSSGPSKLVWRSSPTLLKLLTGGKMSLVATGNTATPSSSHAPVGTASSSTQRQASPLKPANLGRAFDKALEDDSGLVNIGEPSPMV